MKQTLTCKKCGEVVELYKNPKPTVDIIIEPEQELGSVILIHRKNEPRVWAIPGGYVDYGESLESAAMREAKEETSLEVKELKQFHAYSDPKRDKREHNISIVFKATAYGKPIAADDADDIGIFRKENLPKELGFDHAKILDDYFKNNY